MSFRILGLGTAIPATRLRQEESAHIAFALAHPTEEQASWLPGIYANSGIRFRNVFYSADEVRDVLNGTTISGSIFLPKGTPEDRGPTTGQRMQRYARHAGPLAVEAARNALSQGLVSPSRVTHLITVSCTGFQAPGIDVQLVKQLGLTPTVERTHIGFMGCHGALNGLRVARAFCDANLSACILLCAVELCSLHYCYGWDPQKAIANALFADGAAALVGTASGTNSDNCWRVVASGSCIIPASEDAMTWTIDDHGFAMTLSKKVPQLIMMHLRPWLSRWLEKQNLRIDDIACWAVHPGGPKILDAVGEALDLKPEALSYSREVLAEHGNMSSPTVLFILDRIFRCHSACPCVALGFGPGLTVEAALVA